MAVEAFFGSSVSNEMSSGAFEYLLSKWKTLQATNALTPQRLTEDSIYKILPSSIWMIASSADFTYFYYGTALQKHTGSDRTGTLMSSNSDIVAREISAIYRRAIDDMTPAFARYTSSSTVAALVWERLILPVPIGDFQMVFGYNELKNRNDEIFDYLFRVDPAAMIVCQPIIDESNRLHDGWILEMNEQARVKLGHSGPMANLRIRDMPVFNDNEFWTAMRRSFTTATPRAQFAHDGRNYELLRFRHVFAIRVL